MRSAIRPACGKSSGMSKCAMPRPYYAAPVIALTIAGVLALFLLCNVVAFRTLVRLHPRRKPIVIALIVIGNVMWLFFPMLNARTDFSRLIRAVFGPPWFAWLCFALLYSGFIAVAWLIVRPHLRLASRFFLWVTLIALVAGVYGALVPLRLEQVPIFLRDLPADADGFQIVELADLHVGLFTRPSRLEKIFATAARLHPDAIVLAGDSIDDDPIFTTKLLDAARTVPPDIPIYAVLGNHEMYGDPVEAIAKLRGSRIHLLLNEGVAIGNLWLAGISDYAARAPQLRPDMAAALANRGGRFPIVVAHQPKAFDEAQRLHVPFTICAHSHGGQCGFRPLRWSLAGLFLPYHMGLYARGGAQLYVNTGTGYWLLPWRLGVTPAITFFELRRAGRPTKVGPTPVH